MCDILTNTNDKKNRLFKENLFNQYKDLAYSISNAYSHNAKDYKEDLEQIALMELWECIDRYDEHKSAFSTYATWCITGKVKQGLVERKGIKRSGSPIFRTMMYIVKNKDKDIQSIYEELEGKEWFNIDKSLFFSIYNNCVSCNNNIEGIFSDEGELISEEDTWDNRDVEDRIYVLQLLNQIQMDLSKKSSERNVELYMKWLNSNIMDDRISFEDIGKEYGICRERVRQIIDNMNKKSRKLLEKIGEKGEK